jgi:multiple sugar transport system permease protein
MTEENFKKILLAFGSAGILLFCLAPVVYMVLTALDAHAGSASGGAPFTTTLAHFRAVLGSESLHFAAYLRNSIAISALSALMSVSIACAAAYAVTRLRFRGGTIFLFIVLAVSMFPQISLVSYLFKFMSALGWINTYAALVLPYTAWTLPLCLWVLVSYFAQLPRDLDKAGLVDGCSRLQILVKILLPIAAPGIFSTLLLAFIFAFNEFLFALMLTTDHAARTIPVGLALFEGLHGQVPWGEIMAAATLATLPVVVLALLFQRRIIQGLTRGAVKE